MNAEERARKNRAYGMGTGVVLIVLGLLSFTAWALRPPTLDVATLCPVDRPLAGHTLVIVDRTDRWSPAIGATLNELIEKAQKETARGARFSIVALDSDLSTRPVFSVCNPGEPTLFTDLYRGRRFTQADFEQKFVGAAERVTAALSAPGEAEKSPIVEYVHRWLGRDDFNASVPDRKIVLISDMRQNSDALSVYADSGDRKADLARLVEREFGRAGKGVTFDVYFVAHGRDYNVSEAVVRDAWDAAFRGIDATYEWRQIY